MSYTDVLLIYPQLGSWDDVVRDIPLSLIYAATHSAKRGFQVKIVDLRLWGDNWRRAVDPVLQKGCSLVGLSVMTGNPIRTSLRISRYIKDRYDMPIVWGGPHPTILPEQTLEDPSIDFVIRDWGSKALCQLIEHLKGGSIGKEEILGLGYKGSGKVCLSPPQTSFEILDFRDLPYQLVEISGEKYNRLQSDELIFPIYTSVGCPHKCSFCMAPAVYKKITGKKWIGLDIDYVLDHIEYLSSRYQFNRLQVYDDESFVNLDRMYDLLTEYIKRGFNRNFKLDFRGVRVSDLDRMDDDYLRLLVTAGVDMMFIGVESGSPRILKLMNKGITVNQTIRVNRRLARYPSLKPHYNFFCGIPGETIESLLQTKELLLQLVEDHPGCYLGYSADWKPIPGSELTGVAVRDYGLRLPSSLEEWAAIDSRDSAPLDHPWYTPEMRGMIDLLAVIGLALDAKAVDLSGNLGPVLGRILYGLVMLYRPLLRLRVRFNFTGLLLERKMYDLFMHRLGKLLSV